MPDKIRIVGEFSDNIIGKVQSLVAGETGVTTVSVLKAGVETYPQAEAPQAGAEDAGATS